MMIGLCDQCVDGIGGYFYEGFVWLMRKRMKERILFIDGTRN